MFCALYAFRYKHNTDQNDSLFCWLLHSSIVPMFMTGGMDEKSWLFYDFQIDPFFTSRHKKLYMGFSHIGEKRRILLNPNCVSSSHRERCNFHDKQHEMQRAWKENELLDWHKNADNALRGSFFVVMFIQLYLVSINCKFMSKNSSSSLMRAVIRQSIEISAKVPKVFKSLLSHNLMQKTLEFWNLWSMRFYLFFFIKTLT
jgi:hypothetical protein